MQVDRLDHLVLTVKDIAQTCEFYGAVLGMQTITFGDNRTALTFGRQKINLHEHGKDLTLVAHDPTLGSADLCFITKTPLAEVFEHLRRHEVEILAGPITRHGALGPIESVYFRDPDRNLIEVSNYGAEVESGE